MKTSGRFDYPQGVFCLLDLLDEKECEELIEYSELKGFSEAAINAGGKQEIFKAIRNNDRIMFDDISLAKKIFIKLKGLIPEFVDDWELEGLNERWRFYRYENLQYFKWHRDGVFKRSETEESKITLMIYLNSDFEGGSTDFKRTDEVPETGMPYKEFRVWPKGGMALLFPHKLMHQGAPVTRGAKYVLRTDVMYKRIDS